MFASWRRSSRKQLDPVHARHLQIRDDEIGRVLAGDPERRGPVGGRDHGVALLLQELLETAARARLVVDDQNAAVRLHGDPSHHGARSARDQNLIGGEMRKIVRPGRLSDVDRALVIRNVGQASGTRQEHPDQARPGARTSSALSPSECAQPRCGSDRGSVVVAVLVHRRPECHAPARRERPRRLVRGRRARRHCPLRGVDASAPARRSTRPARHAHRRRRPPVRRQLDVDGRAGGRRDRYHHRRERCDQDPP